MVTRCLSWSCSCVTAHVLSSSSCGEAVPGCSAEVGGPHRCSMSSPAFLPPQKPHVGRWGWGTKSSQTRTGQPRGGPDRPWLRKSRRDEGSGGRGTSWRLRQNQWRLSQRRWVLRVPLPRRQYTLDGDISHQGAGGPGKSQPFPQEGGPVGPCSPRWEAGVRGTNLGLGPKRGHTLLTPQSPPYLRGIRSQTPGHARAHGRCHSLWVRMSPWEEPRPRRNQNQRTSVQGLTGLLTRYCSPVTR